MGNELAFLQGIVANPADETLRLVFADWLEEQGDWRAEFLRLDATLRRAASGPTDAAGWARWRELRSQLSPSWLAVLGKQPILRLVTHENPKRVLRCPPGRYLLGRSTNCQVRFQDDAVSRHHAALQVSVDGASLCDLGSRHGTAVNGWRLRGERALCAGDRVSVASNTFLVQFVREEDSSGLDCLTVPHEGEGQAVEIPASRGSPCLPASAPLRDWAWKSEWPSAKLHIYSGVWHMDNCFGLERGLDQLLGGDGYVTHDEDQGPEWGIDLVLRPGAEVEAWVARLVTFLQHWPVPAGTWLSVIAYPSTGGFKHQRLEIPS
jgi:uncharacterized protein (TIGR02996 family)